ncbi:MAG: uroporphyrinogen decarboxylase family protein [Methanomassiliicoccales archaeon]|nr:uroporphyrinogen decarboxylase family protein [Methanomassiliicoccales archaeon]
MKAMTPKQRLEAALDRQPVDHVPLFYQHLGASSHLQKSTGISVKEGFEDPEKFARLSMEAHRLFRFDNVMAGWGDILIESQAHGTKWRFTDPRFYPRVESYVPMDQVGAIRPVDPMQDPNWSVMLRGARIMMERIGHEVAVVGCIDSPMVISMETIGMENLMMSTFQSPELAHYLLRTVTESSIAYMEHIHKLGMEEVFIENGSAGGEMVSVEMYEMFDRRYLAELVQWCSKLGLRTIVHNCAAQPLYMSEAELRPTALHVHLAAVEVGELFSNLKGKTCVMAGIDHANLLFKRSPEDVEAEVERIIRAWGEGDGLIMAPGCEMPYKTPLENLQRLRESTIRHGRG